MDLPTFWYWLLVACLVWYSTVTLVVAVRGVWDIRNMLRRIRETNQQDANPESAAREP